MKANRSSVGEAGEDSWSSIARWNFCWRIDDELLREGVDRPGHHDQPGDDEDDVLEAVERVDAGAERGSEDGDVEEGLEERRADRLALDLHEPAHLAPDQGREADLRGAQETISSTRARESSLRPTSSR